MKKKLKLFCFILLLTFVSNSVFSYSSLPDKKIKIAVTTSNLAALLEVICKDRIDVITIIPSNLYPETYDVDAKTIKELSRCNAILYHSWQPWVKDLKYKISNLGIVYRELKTEGNLMIPYINLRAAQELMEVLSVWNQENKDFFENNFLDYSFKVNYICEEISKKNYLRYNKKIVCNNKIASFMEWLGFDVVVSYGKANNISSAEMLNLTKKVKKEKIKYDVDNLQAGTDIGRKLSNDLKIEHIVISNFVLGKSYINTLKNNVEKIDKALNK